MGDVQGKLEAMGRRWPEAPKPAGSYLPALLSGNLLYVSGQLPLKDGELVSTGPVASSASVEQAKEAARQCVLNGLAIVRQELEGDLSRLVQVVRVGVFVQSDDDFDGQPEVANGASDLLAELLGERGRHARAAVGANALPKNATVEVELVVEVR